MGLAAAPKAAKGLLKLRPNSARLARVANDSEKWNKRSGTVFLAGAVPGATNTIWNSQVQRRDADIAQRKLRADGSLRAKPIKEPIGKSTSWQSYVSPEAVAGHNHLLSGAMQARRNARSINAAGSAALVGGVGSGMATLGAVPGKKGKLIGSGLAAAGIGAKAATTAAAKKQAEKSKRWAKKANHISNVGWSRRATVESARPGADADELMSPQVAKALLKPTGMVMGAAMRRSSVARTSSGKLVARRGAVARTSRPGSGVA